MLLIVRTQQVAKQHASQAAGLRRSATAELDSAVYSSNSKMDSSGSDFYSKKPTRPNRIARKPLPRLAVEQNLRGPKTRARALDLHADTDAQQATRWVPHDNDGMVHANAGAPFPTAAPAQALLSTDSDNEIEVDVAHPLKAAQPGGEERRHASCYEQLTPRAVDGPSSTTTTRIRSALRPPAAVLDRLSWLIDSRRELVIWHTHRFGW